MLKPSRSSEKKAYFSPFTDKHTETQRKKVAKGSTAFKWYIWDSKWEHLPCLTPLCRPSQGGAIGRARPQGCPRLRRKPIQWSLLRICHDNREVATKSLREVRAVLKTGFAGQQCSVRQKGLQGDTSRGSRGTETAAVRSWGSEALRSQGPGSAPGGDGWPFSCLRPTSAPA